MSVADVTIPTIKAFCNLDPKAQALKPLEEAAEVYAAWQYMLDCKEIGVDMKYALSDILDEIADCVQACANLAAMVGCSDLTPYMERCERRNRERGRYGDE